MISKVYMCWLDWIACSVTDDLVDLSYYLLKYCGESNTSQMVFLREASQDAWSSRDMITNVI